MNSRDKKNRRKIRLAPLEWSNRQGTVHKARVTWLPPVFFFSFFFVTSLPLSPRTNAVPSICTHILLRCMVEPGELGFCTSHVQPIVVEGFPSNCPPAYVAYVEDGLLRRLWGTYYFALYYLVKGTENLISGAYLKAGHGWYILGAILRAESQVFFLFFGFLGFFCILYFVFFGFRFLVFVFGFFLFFCLGPWCAVDDHLVVSIRSGMYQ